MNGLAIKKITPNIGAYVENAAADLLQGDMPAQLMDALNTYNVLVFPKVGLTDEQLIELSGKMGVMEPATTTNDGSATDRHGIYRVALDKSDKTQLDYVKGNDYWHMDGTSYAIPGKGTLLKCERPPNKGGETGFANLYAAYAALPDEKKQQLEGLKVEHCLAAVGIKMYDAPTEEDFARWNAVFPETEHSLVWKQEGGKASLLIGSTANRVLGLSDEDSQKLLDELLDWATQPQFTYEHTWSKGDLVIFNNPGLLHRSRPYSEDSGRLMHRSTLKG